MGLPLTLAALAAAIFAGTGSFAFGQPQEPAGIQKIQHIIWIIQENRSYDNYFGTYPGADGFPPGTCSPVLPGAKRCIKPFHMHIAHARLRP